MRYYVASELERNSPMTTDLKIREQEADLRQERFDLLKQLLEVDGRLADLTAEKISLAATGAAIVIAAEGGLNNQMSLTSGVEHINNDLVGINHDRKRTADHAARELSLIYKLCPERNEKNSRTIVHDEYVLKSPAELEAERAAREARGKEARARRAKRNPPNNPDNDPGPWRAGGVD